MTQRIAACMGLVAFAVCILTGLQAGNTFSTIVTKALFALIATFVLGLVLGSMAQKMIDENVAASNPSPANPGDSQANSEASDR